MKNILHITFAFAAICSAPIIIPECVLAQPIPNLVSQAVDNTKRVVLAGNTRPEAVVSNSIGRVEDSMVLDHMQLLLKRSAAQETALDAFITGLHDPHSPSFHQWITAAQFGERFGLSQQDIGTITQWLQSQGFSVNVVYPHGVIDFSGTAGQVRSAFGTEIHRLNVNGEAHVANMSDPSIPAALAPAVHGIVSLHDFRPTGRPVARPQYTIGSSILVVPEDLATIYNLTPLFNKGYSGSNQTIVLIEDTYLYNSTNDWTTFRNKFGLSTFTSGSLTQVAPAPSMGPNNCTAPDINGDDGEAAIDVEWASATAPSAALILAACADSYTFGGLIALENLLSQPNPPPIVSISYGVAEALNGAAGNQVFYNTYQMAATEGVSVFVAAGDWGAAIADVSYGNSLDATHGIGANALGSTPYNVAVGGTDFADPALYPNSKYWNSTNDAAYGSAKSYVPEIPWNDSCASQLRAQYVTGSPVTYGSTGFCNLGGPLNFIAGSGGPSGCAMGSPSIDGVVSGTCSGWPKPSWQSVVGNPSDGARDLPDVALFASNGIWGHYYVTCYSDPVGGAPCTGAPSSWAGFGGTSVATPIMAGIQALVNQYTGSRWGNPNPIYYQLARTEYGASGNSSCNSTGASAPASSCVFNDVTQGDTDVPCTGSNNCYTPSGTYGVLSTSNTAYQPAYAAGVGWDFATGIGSVNAYNLVTNFVTGPIITSLSPSSATAGLPGFTLTINGANFVSGAVAKWGSTALTTTYLSATQLWAAVPAALIATAGSASVTVTTSGGTSAGAVFTINSNSSSVPTITSLSPSSAIAGGPVFTLTISGTNFVAGAVANWGTTALTTTYVNATVLWAAVPAALIATPGSVSVTVTTSGGTSSGATFTISPAAPTITSLSPSSATAGGPGFTLTINGTNFIAGAVASWGSTALTTTYLSATQLTAAVPASLIATAGSASVTVTTAGGTSGGATFTINPSGPIITSLSPSSANAGGAGFTLTINGTNFVAGAAAKWGATALTTTYVNATLLWAAVPAALIATPGSATVTVTTASGTSAGAAFTINPSAAAPTITSLSPSSANAGGAGFTLTINGTNFIAGAVANWGSTALTTTFLSATQLWAAVPAALIATAGSASVTVSTAGGTSAGATFTINPSSTPGPTITSLSPSSAIAGGAGFTLTINGTNFVSGAVAKWGTTALTTTYVNTAMLWAAIPASLIATAGSANVTVTTSGGTSAGATFTINPSASAPTITSLSPSSATAGGPGFTLTINGTNFVTGAVANWGSTALTTTYLSATQLWATVPAALIATAGSASVTVTTAGGTSAGATFTINPSAPTITSLSPNSATAGGPGFTLTINGTNFIAGAVASWGSTALTTTYLSATQLWAAVPAALIATAGSASVTVTTAGGTSAGATFTINPSAAAPTITSLSPNSATAGGPGFTLTINGTNFVAGAAASWGSTALATTYLSTTQLWAAVPASLIATAGSATVTVTTAGGTSAGATFTINPGATPAPTITSLSPNSATAGGPGFTLTINGANFIAGAVASWGSTALTTTYLSATQLWAAVPASLIATAGSASVTVTTAGGTSAGAVFTINPNSSPGPTITSLSPSSAIAGAPGFTLTINGTNFVAGATAKWGTTALTTTYVNAALLWAAVPAALIATPGSASVTVTTAGGTSAGATFTINPSAAAPTVTSLSPSSATAGGPGFTLTINGTNFIAGAVASWGSTALATTYLSATQLTAAVPAALIATAGSASVTVTTSGGTSAGATFTINPNSTPGPTITSLSPSSATAGRAGFTLTINGTSFVAGAVAKWGTTALTTTYVNPTLLWAAVPETLIATPGSASVTVTTASGTSAGATFTINPNL